MAWEDAEWPEVYLSVNEAAQGKMKREEQDDEEKFFACGQNSCSCYNPRFADAVLIVVIFHNR